MRLYLVASVVFFLVLAFVDNPDRPVDARGTSVHDARAPALGTPGLAAKRGGAQFSVSDGAAAEAAGHRKGAYISIDTLHGPRWLQARLRPTTRRLVSMPPQQAVAMVKSGALAAAPKVGFVLLPIFALILKLLYVRRRRLYVEHFVFALHTHAVAFVAFTAMLLVPYWPARALLALWLVAYSFRAMRVVYGQGPLMTAAKITALGAVYFVALVFGVTGALMFAILSI
jgi:hypothetical protein